MRPGSPVRIRISRNTIERGDVGKVLTLLDSFVPSELESRRNRVVFHVGGYDGDGRELYETGEVRDFFARLFGACPGIFHWLEASDAGLLFLALMICTPVQDGHEVGIAGEDMEVFLADGLRGLHAFSDKHGIDPEPSVQAVTRLIRRKIGQ